MEKNDVQTDVEALRNALITTNKDELINILCSQNLEQRRELTKQFNQAADTILEDQIKSRFDGDYQKMMLALIMDPIEFYVDELHAAIEKLQTSILNIFNTFARPRYSTIANILCTLSNREINELKSLYENRYGRQLEKDIRDNLSLHLKELLLAVCKSNRNESDVTDLVAAMEDAQKLSKENNPYNEEALFIEIFSERNFHQINLIVQEFKKITGEPIETRIQSIFKQEDVVGFTAIVEYSEDKYFYYARCLFEGLDSGNSSLIGLILLQCDDLVNVKRSFELNFGDSLRQFISSKSSKHYKYALYKLFGETRSNNA